MKFTEYKLGPSSFSTFWTWGKDMERVASFAAVFRLVLPHKRRLWGGTSLKTAAKEAMERVTMPYEAFAKENI